MKRKWNCFNWVERDYDGDAVVNDDVVNDDNIDDDVVNGSNNEASTMLSSVDGTAWYDAMDAGNGKGTELL